MYRYNKIISSVCLCFFIFSTSFSSEYFLDEYDATILQEVRFYQHMVFACSITILCLSFCLLHQWCEVRDNRNKIGDLESKNTKLNNCYQKLTNLYCKQNKLDKKTNNDECGVIIPWFSGVIEQNEKLVDQYEKLKEKNDKEVELRKDADKDVKLLEKNVSTLTTENKSLKKQAEHLQTQLGVGDTLA